MTTPGNYNTTAPSTGTAAVAIPTPVPLNLGGTGVNAASDAALLTALGGLVLQAATPVGGFALTGGTPTILTWTPPNDGKLHRVKVFASMHVTVSTTGGEVDLDFNLPDGTATSEAIYTATQGTGAPWPNEVSRVVQGGVAVTVVQSSAVTVGAAVVWAELWGL